MISSRTYTSQGLVLKYFPYKEADLILTVLTKQHGKLQAIAKGARKPQSKFSGHVEPLTVVDIQLAKGKSIETVTQVQTYKAYPSMYSDINKLANGIYISELIDQFTPDKEVNTKLFDTGIKVLDIISTSEEPDLSIRNFEFEVLKLSGFLPELYTCLKCGCEIIAGQHRYSVSSGGVICIDCSDIDNTLELSLATMKVLRYFNRHNITTEPAFKIKTETYTELKSLLIETIIFWLERDLKSSQFIEHLKSIQKSYQRHDRII